MQLEGNRQVTAAAAPSLFHFTCLDKWAAFTARSNKSCWHTACLLPLGNSCCSQKGDFTVDGTKQQLLLPVLRKSRTADTEEEKAAGASAHGSGTYTMKQKRAG